MTESTGFNFSTVPNYPNTDFNFLTCSPFSTKMLEQLSKKDFTGSHAVVDADVKTGGGDGDNNTQSGSLKDDNLGNSLKLLETIECPVCNEIPSSPIPTCTQGHHVCKKCRNKMYHCGVCRSPFGGGRSIVLETIVNESKFRCQYFDENGCRQLLKSDQVHKHIEECPYRPIICDYQFGTTKCNGTPVLMKNYQNHLINDHGFIVNDCNFTNVFGHKLVIDIDLASLCPNWSYKPFCMNSNGKIFLGNIKIKEGIMNCWVTLFGSEDAAAKFICKLIIQNDLKQVSKIEWTVPVHHIRKSVELIYQEGLHFSVPLLCLKPFIMEEHSVRSLYLLFKVEEKTPAVLGRKQQNGNKI